MVRYFLLLTLLAGVVVVAVAGWRGQHSDKPPIQIFPDMRWQPRFDPQHESGFYADGRAARPPVPGTVPLGYSIPGAYYTTGAGNNALAKAPGAFSNAPDYSNTGRISGVYGDGIPPEILSPALLARGRERFNIHCAPCHGATASGNGIVQQLGLATVANLQDARLLAMPDGQIFNTITLGKNTMGAYGSNLTVEDRWAVVAYLRALQRSQHARLDDVPGGSRAALDNTQPALKK